MPFILEMKIQNWKNYIPEKQIRNKLLCSGKKIRNRIQKSKSHFGKTIPVCKKYVLNKKIQKYIQKGV